LLVLYSAAHGGFAEDISLGGGAAICRQLLEEWQRTQPFEVRLLSPDILGPGAPDARDLLRFNESDYGRFCRRFERAVTAEALRHHPASTVLLVNDVSEGPDFARLAQAGFRIATIFHVDVVAYVSAIYGRGLLAPRTLARWGERLCPALPDISSLIFWKQRDSLRHSRAVMVPSRAMRDALLECYPETPPERIHAIPWGAPETEAATPQEIAALRAEYGVPHGARVLLTLSRIAPEKGQDRLLRALQGWHGPPLWLFICGAPAFMHGERFAAKLRKLAGQLRGVTVVFPGHVTGHRKQAFFGMADLYVFPSRHESYGLTLAEALSAGLPAICLDSHGARETGAQVVPEANLLPAIREALVQPRRQSIAVPRFAGAAARLAALLRDLGG
jgi:glycosyltransferase involved in cell wall biosynthesis